MRKLITSLKEVLKTGDCKITPYIGYNLYSLLHTVHSSALETYAADLVKFGTVTSATESEIGTL